MVFESFISPTFAEKKPYIIFFIGLIYTTIAIFLANYIFPQNTSIVVVFIISFFFIPLFYRTMIYEEKEDLTQKTEKSILKQHSKALMFFMFLFLGVTIAYMIWFLILSSSNSALFNSVFSMQESTIHEINGKVTESQIVQSFSHFGTIFNNNVRVLMFCILFSFIFGAGSIFILSWNASVIGFALGKYALDIVHTATNVTSLIYLKGASMAFLRYLIHGIPEILAYFTAGLAGGIISVAIIKHDLGSEKNEKIMVDAAMLFLISFVILFISAALEVWVTPIFIGGYI